MRIPLHVMSGFSLVEVTIALGVSTFCLIVILGLLPVGLTSSQATIHQTEAASLARGIMADLRSTAKTSSLSPQYSIPLPTPTAGTTLYLRSDSTKAVAATGDEYCATLFVTSPSGTQKAPTMVRILVTWPASAPVSPAMYSGSYEVTTAVDRN